MPSSRRPEPPPAFAGGAPYAIAAVGGAVHLEGDLTTAHATEIWRELCAATSRTEGACDLDLSGARVVDGGIMSLLVQRRLELVTGGTTCELRGASPQVAELVHLYRGDVAPVRRRRRRPEGFVDNVGRTTAGVLEEVRLVVAFLGQTLAAAGGVVRRLRTGNWKDIWPIVERAGVDAVPIVLLINFLVGFVMGYQSANQLRQYGASIFVADLVGLSMTRELAPLMTAIIVCGRSGASIAAELGSMRVSEEIDALRTIGLGPLRYLVLPRALALLIVTPILTLFGDVVGIVGGLTVGVASLDLSIPAYLQETRNAVHLTDVGTGLLKSVVFAFAIAVIACQQGFATSGGAEGVGRRTTSTVVTCLFAIVLLDALFTVIFRFFDV